MKSTEELIAELLPRYWSYYFHDEQEMMTICECDEPTFYVYPDRIEWVKPVEEFEAEFRDDDSEIAAEWRKEAEKLFAKIQAFFK